MIDRKQEEDDRLKEGRMGKRAIRGCILKVYLLCSCVCVCVRADVQYLNKRTDGSQTRPNINKKKFCVNIVKRWWHNLSS